MVVCAASTARFAFASLAARLLLTHTCCAPALTEEEEGEEEEGEEEGDRGIEGLGCGHGDESRADSLAMLSSVEAVECLVSLYP